MPAMEIAQWERHFLTCPPGDWRTQHLLAEVVSVIERGLCALGGGKAKPRKALDIAPWLKSPELEKLMAERESAHRRRFILDLTS